MELYVFKLYFVYVCTCSESKHTKYGESDTACFLFVQLHIHFLLRLCYNSFVEIEMDKQEVK